MSIWSDKDRYQDINRENHERESRVNDGRSYGVIKNNAKKKL